jgi:NTP pyrophosphatase (non-canonical NTP hydrolase)
MNIEELKTKMYEERDTHNLYTPMTRAAKVIETDLTDHSEITDIYQFTSNIAMEECAELIQAISKIYRDHIENKQDENHKLNLAEEMADVLMMIERLRIIYKIDNEIIDRILYVKIRRYEDYVSKEYMRKKD